MTGFPTTDPLRDGPTLVTVSAERLARLEAIEEAAGHLVTLLEEQSDAARRTGATSRVAPPAQKHFRSHEVAAVRALREAWRK